MKRNGSPVERAAVHGPRALASPQRRSAGRRGRVAWVRLRASLCAAALTALACASPPPEPAPLLLRAGRPVMGTLFEISLVAPDLERGEALLDQLFARAEDFDRIFSLYAADSPLSRINAAGGSGGVPADPEILRLLERSDELRALSRGSFDVGIGTLLRRWRRAEREGRAPSDAELDALRAQLVGPAVEVTPQGVLRLRPPDYALDFDGIAKGYALDRMRPLLAQAGVANALLSLGGSSVWALGRPPGAAGWRLLLHGEDGAPDTLLLLADRALSVSESFGTSLVIGGRRYGHIFDPRTGRPLETQRQAIVVARDATLAEALSKALLLLEADEGRALVASQPDCEARIRGSSGVIWQSPGFEQMLARD